MYLDPPDPHPCITPSVFLSHSAVFLPINSSQCNDFDDTPRDCEQHHDNSREESLSIGMTAVRIWND